MRDPKYAMVVLDELNSAVQHEYIDAAVVAVRNRPVMSHVVLNRTGSETLLGLYRRSEGKTVLHADQ